MRFTKVFDDIVNVARHSRYVICYGGSSSSKSISILQYLTLYAFKHHNKRVTISSESLPVIKKTVFEDWKQVVMGELFNDKYFNKSEMVYRFPTGTVFNFIPADDSSRWHGLRQDIVYFDELYHIKKSIYDQADIRTREKVFSSFNPVSDFWITDSFEDEATSVLHSTYKDNQFVEKQIIKALEKRIATDKNFHDVYVKGLFGSLEGVIFKEGEHWDTTDTMPENPSREILGLDFGFSVDPTAIVHVAYSDGQIWLTEMLYERELTNPDILPYLPTLTIADSAEPKSIEELRRMGAEVLPAKKGADSINNGIQLMKQFKININKDSTNLIKEFRNYSWSTNRQGETLTKPVDDFNHCIDAIRYAVQHLFNKRKEFILT